MTLRLDKTDTSTRAGSVTTATSSPRGSNPRARVPDTAWHARFLAALARTGQVGAAAQAVGVTRSTAYDHRSRYPAFREAWSDTLEVGLDDVECALMERAKAGDVRACIWLLTRLRPSVYAASAVCPSCRHRAAEDTNGSPVLKVATLAEQEAEITRILRE